MNKFRARLLTSLITWLIGDRPVIANVIINTPPGWSTICIPSPGAEGDPKAIIVTRTSYGVLIFNNRITGISAAYTDDDGVFWQEPDDYEPLEATERRVVAWWPLPPKVAGGES